MIFLGPPKKKLKTKNWLTHCLTHNLGLPRIAIKPNQDRYIYQIFSRHIPDQTLSQRKGVLSSCVSVFSFKFQNNNNSKSQREILQLIHRSVLRDGGVNRAQPSFRDNVSGRDWRCLSYSGNHRHNHGCSLPRSR